MTSAVRAESPGLHPTAPYGWGDAGMQGRWDLGCSFGMWSLFFYSSPPSPGHVCLSLGLKTGGKRKQAHSNTKDFSRHGWLASHKEWDAELRAPVAGDGCAESGHLASCVALAGSLKRNTNTRLEGLATWGGHSIPVRLLAPLGVRHVVFHRLLCVCALLGAVNVAQVTVAISSHPLLPPGLPWPLSCCGR